jgi:hypothetical protein
MRQRAEKAQNIASENQLDGQFRVMWEIDPWYSVQGSLGRILIS